jgi:peptidoglycan/LPS O-acetylase OafA/YrhL
MRDPSSLPRPIPALDGIRGLAIIWVLFHNALAGGSAPSGRLLHALLLLAHPGWIGVQLFFALSGFLITGGLLDARGSPHYFRDFYARRALRILPLYYTVLLALLVLLPRVTTPGPPYSNDHQAPLWLFTANWAQSLPYGFGHFWSLALEEQFYLIWPLLTRGLPARRMLKACLWIAAGALLLRCALLVCGASSWTLYANTACRMDALALGGAGACVLRVAALRQRLVPRLQHFGAVALLVFLLGIPLYAPERLGGETVGYSLLAFSSAAFVTWAALSDPARTRLARVLTWSPLRSCGKYSYAMYVFHNLLHKLLGEPWLAGRFGEQPPLSVVFGYALVLLLISYLLAFASYHALEKHFLRLKGAFGPRGG